MFILLSYWYLQSFPRFYNALSHTIGMLEGTWAIRDTARNITKPLFQDYTIGGRVVGIFLRIFRILIGLVVYGFVSLAYGLAYLIWIFFPVICCAAILGSFMGQPTSGGIQ